MGNNKFSSQGGGMAKAFLTCVAICMGIILILSVIGALIAIGLDDPTGSLPMLSLGVIIISAIAGGVCCSRIKGDGGVGFASLVALSIVLIALIINVIACAGKVSPASFMNYLCYFGAASLSAYIGRRKRGQKRHRK
jgi:hypothetical protein